MLLAQDILRKARGHFAEIKSESLIPLQLEIEEKYLLTLASLGNQAQVAVLIDELISQGVVSEDLYGLGGRCHKDLYRESEDLKHLEKAFDYYHSGFLEQNKSSFYLAVNAASCAAILRKEQTAERLAHSVLEIVSTSKDPSAWELAAQGECHLIMNRKADASSCYMAAARLGKGDLIMRTSMRKQARWLLRHLGESENELDDCFDIGPLVVFAGHLPDKPDRNDIRFPASSFANVRQALSGLLNATRPEVAFVSAAAGADLIFLECLMDRGIPFHIVLPCPANEFRKLSVTPYGHEWDKTFEESIARAESVRHTSHRDAPETDAAWEFASQCLSGFAMLHARSNSLDLTPVAVWDSERGEAGGTGGFVRFWMKQAVELLKIEPLSGDRQTLGCGSFEPKPEYGTEKGDDRAQAVRAMVFADVKGYTSLRDNQMSAFVQRFMGLAALVLEEGAFQPLAANSWGDAIYTVFRTPAEAGNFSIDLLKRINEMPWEKHGLPADINFRISCHAGPVHEAMDPVTRRTTFYGLHVSQTARIEPITPPGMAYVSEEFAALAMLDPETRFSSEFIGCAPLAKGFGKLRLYKLQNIQAPVI